MNFASQLRRSSLLLRRLHPLAVRPRACIAVVGLVAFVGSLLVAVRLGEHRASVHDEFANLLGADTFAHGRIANPTPELWPYFESPHVLVRPAYASKYPPGQSLFMAVGQVLTGHPLVGVWLSVALACAAICWMLQALLPSRWALAGGLLAAARLVLLAEGGRWSQSYWGGAVAVLGAALEIGAFLRLRSHPRTRDAVIFACGLLLLAISRPFEGLLLSLPMAGALLLGRPAFRVLAPAVAMLLSGLVLLGVYNARVTGHFWILPHAEYQHQYAISPMFLWQQLHPQPTYGTAILEKYNREFEVETYDRLHTASGYVKELAERAKDVPDVFLGLPLALSLLLLPWIPWPGTARWLLASALLLALGLMQTTYYHPHYAAPLMPIFILFSLQGLRIAQTWRWREVRIGRAIPLLVTVILLGQLMWSARSLRPFVGWPAQREVIEKKLARLGGKHLVIVRYGSDHSPHQEWVYNGADLETAPVLWIHELHPEPDQTLLAKYRDRTLWLVQPDHGPSSLRPYLLKEDDRRKHRPTKPGVR